jgi:glucose/arabinose dehydrogenase
MCAALAIVAVACGRNTDVEGRRVIASPRGAEVVETLPPAAPTAVPLSSPSGTIPRRTTLPPPPPGSLARARVKLTSIAELDQPLAMAVRKGDGGLYVAEKTGHVRVIRDGKLASGDVLDISAQVSTSSEQGLLGLAFSPDGTMMYVNFTNTAGDTVVREYVFAGGQAEPTSARQVLFVDQPFANHNGGNLVFGPDGYLYIGLGDGGSAGDPMGNGQNLDVLLGKMLRIDPRASGTDAYRIPPDNPFVGRSGRDEIWAYGLRNPWRYSFDRATGDLWTGDVGQNAWEEIDFQRGSSKGGDNYGWNRMEGSHNYNGTEPANHHAPIYEYSSGSGTEECAVTAGYVYRGSRITNLRGAFVFADFCVGSLRAFIQKNGRATEHRYLGEQIGNLSSFGEDHRGELYAMSLSGGVYRIDPA